MKKKYFETYKKLVKLYKNQVSMSHRTTTSILLQQYSTPAPIGYLMGVYCSIMDRGLYFEPSAGNGLLTIAGNPNNFIVNEIDKVRRNNLACQGYLKIMDKDASIPFKEYQKKFDSILTNPPFGNVEVAVDYSTFPIKSLEQLMALRALDCMKDSGYAAIIIGGHLQYDSEGRIQAGKNRIFFNYLFHFYNVEDVINIDGHSLYSRQGTAFNTRLILINGRKKEPEGYAPLLDESLDVVDNMSNIPVSDFDTLLKRVEKLF